MRPPVGIRIAVQESTLIRLAYGQPPSPLQGEGYFAPGALAQKTQAQCENRTRNKFCTPRAQWPGRKRGQALLVLRAGNEEQPLRSASPVMGVRGKANMSAKRSSEPSPGAFWLLCRRGQSSPPSADGGTPCKNLRRINDLGSPNFLPPPPSQVTPDQQENPRQSGE